MNNKKILYDEKRHRRNFYGSHGSISKRERLPYLILGFLFIGIIILTAVGQLLKIGNSIPWPLMAMGYPALLIFGILGIYAYFTFVNLKVYPDGILLPEKSFFGDKKFVPFEEVEKVVVIKNINDIYPNYAKKPYDYLIYLTKPNENIKIKKDKEILNEIKRKDSRIWQVMNYQDVINLRKFLKAVKGKVKIEIIK